MLVVVGDAAAKLGESDLFRATRRAPSTTLSSIVNSDGSTLRSERRELAEPFPQLVAAPWMAPIS